MADDGTAEGQFAAIVHAMAGMDGVSLGSGRRGFGSDALTVHGRIFAMVSDGNIVLKLPGERVAGLRATGEGMAFDAGKGRPMKEWVALRDTSAERALSLAREARAFVAGHDRA
jgi:TfoX/Sxy family transcriptional regulator of competence genes